MSRAALSTPSLQQIIDRARILVIDDQEFAYETLFREEGYNIIKWNDVNRFTEIEQGKFDVILLDLQGIGREVSQDQGLGVLRHIKSARPSQVVVAYSNADWPVKYQSFFERADRIFEKSADYGDFKRGVDELLQEHFSLGFHLHRIDRTLLEFGTDSWRTRRFARAAVSTGNADKLQKLLKSKGIDPESVQIVLALVQAASGVAQIWSA